MGTWMSVMVAFVGGAVVADFVLSLARLSRWKKGFDQGYELGKKHGTEIGELKEAKRAWKEYQARMESLTAVESNERMDN